MTAETRRTFTPGPWKVREGLFFNIDDAGMTPLLTVHDENPIGIAWLTKARPEAQGNARLIAAAPEMYDALCDLLGFLESLPGDWEGDEGIEAARAAIAKAEGR